MRIEPFKPEHLWQIDLQPAQCSWYEYGTDAYAAELALGLGYTLRIAGRIVLCGGIIEVDARTGHLWCFLSVDARHYLVRLHRAARRFLEVTGKRHLIATTESDFADGCRWLEMLGFTRRAGAEGLLPKAGPDGRDHILYEKVH